MFLLGLKGVYSSRTTEGAANFLQQYTRFLNVRYTIMYCMNFDYIVYYKFKNLGSGFIVI